MFPRTLQLTGDDSPDWFSRKRPAARPPLDEGAEARGETRSGHVHPRLPLGLAAKKGSGRAYSPLTEVRKGHSLTLGDSAR